MAEPSSAKGPKGKVPHYVRDTVVLALVAFVTVFLARAYFRSLEAVPVGTFLTLQMRLRPAPRPSGAVAIVVIDDRTLERFGRDSLSLAEYAALISALKNYRTAIVALVLDPEVFYRNGSDADRGILANAIKAQGATYLPSVFSSEESSDSYSLSSDRAVSAAGAVQYEVVRVAALPHHRVRAILMEPSSVQVSRTYLGPPAALAKVSAGTAYLNYATWGCWSGACAAQIADATQLQNRYYAPLMVAVASRYLQNKPARLVVGDGEAAAYLGDDRLPFWVNVRSPGAFAEFSASDVVDGKVPQSAFESKIVLIGYAGDILTTYAGPRTLAEFHASATEDAVSGHFIRSNSAIEALFWLLLVATTGLGGLGWCASLPPSSATWYSFGAITLMAMAIVAIAVYDMSVRGVIYFGASYAPSLIIAGILATAITALRRKREQRLLRAAFEHYLDPKVVNAIVANSASLQPGGTRHHVSVLFADIVNFTAKAESEQPEVLIEMLNDFMAVMTDLVTKTGGVVDKILGDCVMAFWGAPVGTVINSPARMALECGLDMHEELKRLRDKDPRFGDFSIGIGIATGEAIVGNLGGARRFDYSVVGDVVNQAARLEALTRYYEAPILVNAETYREAGSDYAASDLGFVEVKGKQQPIAVWQIAGRRSIARG